MKEKGVVDYWPIEALMEQYYESRASYKSNISNGSFAARQARKGTGSGTGGHGRGSHSEAGSDIDDSTSNHNSDSEAEGKGGSEDEDENETTGNTTQESDDDEAPVAVPKRPAKRQIQVIGEYFLHYI